VVPESSATLSLPGEIRVPLNGNHLTIVKYSSEQDHNFQIVSKTIIRLIQGNRCKLYAPMIYRKAIRDTEPIAAFGGLR